MSQFASLSRHYYYYNYFWYYIIIWTIIYIIIIYHYDVYNLSRYMLDNFTKWIKILKWAKITKWWYTVARTAQRQRYFKILNKKNLLFKDYFSLKFTVINV